MFLPRSVQRKKCTCSPRVTRAAASKQPYSTESSKPYSIPENTETPGSPNAKVKGSEEVIVVGPAVESSSGSEDDEPVLSYSKLQRMPQPGEPLCVMCGRYGAYIVDQTEQDVCSLECKARHLLKLGLPLLPSPSPGPRGAGASPLPPGNEGSRGWTYKEHLQVAEMKEQQVDAFRSQMKIKVSGKSIPRPISDLDQLTIPEKLMSNLQQEGYSSITPVQMQVIPAILYRRDLLVCSATGTGKTLSFLLPIVLHLLRGQGGVASTRHPKALILAPTRELAMQIEEQAKRLMRGVGLMRTGLVIGGMPIANQLHRLRSGVEMIVATPARLNDVIENHSKDIELAEVSVFVLDEVDCLLSMGFEPQVRMIEEMLPSERQSLMFSATIPSSIARMAKDMMTNPVNITIGEPGTPSEPVKHTVLWVEEKSKKKKLLEFFRDQKHFNPPVVVFVGSKKGSLLLADTINKSLIPAATAVGLHGDMIQERRSEILREFLEGKHSVLVATNVMGRGVNLVNVRQVFIFDMPSSLLDFIHQVGRAGRIGETGNAITFINASNKSIFLSFSDLMLRLSVPLPYQLTASPHLVLKREERKRQAASTSNKPVVKKMRKRGN